MISAGEDGLIKNIPIVLKLTDLPDDIENLATAIIFDGETELLTQADDLDDDGEIDEVVFQLPSEIDANTKKKFTLNVKESGINNGQNANKLLKAAQGKYNESYEEWLPSIVYAKYQNSTGHKAPAVDEVGDVVWIDTDWATMCMFISAGWRKSAFKHIFMKEDLWDVVSANWDPWTNWRYKWSRYLWEADNGWHDGNDLGITSDTVEMLKIGPVRCILQTKSGIGYNGAFGKHDALRALRIYSFYSGFPGIHQNLQQTGGDEVAASTDMTALYGGPLQFTSKFVDFSINASTTPWSILPDGNGFNQVYGPGTPNKGGNSDRYQPVDANRVFDLTKTTATYFGMYSSTTKNGYMINFALGLNPSTYISEHVTNIDWSDGEIVIKQEFEEFPLAGINRVMVPFSGSKAGIDVEAYIDTLNGYWTVEYGLQVAEPTTTTIEEELPEITPGFGLLITLTMVGGIAIIYRRRRE